MDIYLSYISTGFITRFSGLSITSEKKLHNFSGGCKNSSRYHKSNLFIYILFEPFQQL